MKNLMIFVLVLIWICSFGQNKKLSDIKSDQFSFLQKSNTTSNFLTKIKENNNNTDLENIIKKYTELKLIDINNNVISEDTLVFDKIYLKDNRPILINIKEAMVYVITGKKDQKLYFYIKGGFFLTDKTPKNDEGKTEGNELARYDLMDAYDDVGYNCNRGKAVHDTILNANLRTIKRAVVFNSTGDATNNDAFVFTNGSNDTRISVGSNFNYKETWFLNVGINTAAANTGLLYSKQSWKNDIGASFTINKVIRKETQFFDSVECSELYDKRLKFKDSIIAKFDDLAKDYPLYKKKLGELKKEKKLNAITDIVERDKKNEQLQKDIDSIEKKIKLVDDVKKDAKKYMMKELVAFDRKRDVLQGSKLHWIKGTINISNQNVSLDSLSLLIGKEITNFPKLSLDLSYNFNRQKKSRLLNVQVFSKVVMGSFLDANINNEKPYLVNNNDETYIFDTAGTQLGKYSKLKRAFWTSQTGMQGTFFMVKNFGISGLASHSFALQTLDGTDYRNRYSLLGGFVFRINNQEDVNKATFRILGGIENEPYKTKALDNFLVKITLGIPFNLFAKK